MADTLENPMHVEVISPDGPIFTQDGVDLVVARAEDGEFGIEKRHLPPCGCSRNVLRAHKDR